MAKHCDGIKTSVNMFLLTGLQAILVFQHGCLLHELHLYNITEICSFKPKYITAFNSSPPPPPINLPYWVEKRKKRRKDRYS